MHRFQTEEDSHIEKSGGYYIHCDGWPNWGFIDYRKTNDGIMIKYKLDPKLTPKNILDFVNPSYQNEEKNQREKIKYQEREAVRAKAYDEYQRATPNGAEQHPYCILKKISGFNKQIKIITNSQQNDICKNGDLIIPLVNIRTRKFQSLQRITFNKMSNGKHMKGIYPNTTLKEACYIFQEVRPSKIIICEGFATGASIFSTCRDRAVVIAAMTCHNMLNIAEAVKHYNLPLIIAGDNDEAGINACEKIKRLIKDSVILLPPNNVNDWNDYITKKIG